jgi:NhaP-type Na+/H+ or K+/H+ antiporter
VELILVVVGAIVVTAIAHRRGLEPALVLVVVGFAVSFAPEFEGVELESEVLLSVVLPPLLYSAALDFSFPTFLRNVRPILGLGVGLVVFAAFAVAGIASWWVLSLTFGTRKRKRSKCSAVVDRRLLTWQESVVVSTDMRGVVTLAAVSGIPLLTTTGQPSRSGRRFRPLRSQSVSARC